MGLRISRSRFFYFGKGIGPGCYRLRPQRFDVKGCGHFRCRYAQHVILQGDFLYGLRLRPKYRYADRIRVDGARLLYGLLSAIEKRLDAGARRVELRLPYGKGGLLDQLYREAKVERVDYGETIEVTAVCTPRTLGQLAEYLADRS